MADPQALVVATAAAQAVELVGLPEAQIPMAQAAIYIALADSLLYPAYAAAPRIWGISPMLDQHIGGLIMWIPGGLFFYAIMSVVFFKWVRRGEDSTAAAQIGWAPVVGKSE